MLLYSLPYVIDRLETGIDYSCTAVDLVPQRYEDLFSGKALVQLEEDLKAMVRVKIDRYMNALYKEVLVDVSDRIKRINRLDEVLALKSDSFLATKFMIADSIRSNVILKEQTVRMFMELESIHEDAKAIHYKRLNLDGFIVDYENATVRDAPVPTIPKVCIEKSLFGTDPNAEMSQADKMLIMRLERNSDGDQDEKIIDKLINPMNTLPDNDIIRDNIEIGAYVDS